MDDTVHILGEGGSIILMSLPLPEAIEDRLHKGYLKRVNADGSPVAEAKPRTRPNVNESKADWVSWAVHEGANPDDADAATKADLIERYGVK
jgi:hypothetical protein